MTSLSARPSGKKLRRAGALMAALAIATTACEEPGARHFDQATLQADLEAARASGSIVGLLAEAQTPSDVIRARAGVAELGTQQPVPWDAQFRAASTTKTFTAVVVLQLVGERRLSLDDTVERWLPGVVAGNGNDGSGITVRQLLQQTSGLFDYVYDPALRAILASDLQRALHDTTSAEAFVAIAMQHAPVFAPGARWGYSNTNYLLAGMIIRAVTGRDWAEEVQQRIIAPLGLAHTALTGADPVLHDPHAHSYIRISDAPDGLIDATDSSLQHTADSALITTTADLNAFFRALASGRLLSPALLAEMQQTVPADDEEFPGGRYGLGLRWQPLSCGGGYWHHEGDGPTGFYTRTGVTPDGRRSVVVSLSSTVNPAAHTAVLELVDRALCDTPAPPPETHP